MVMDGAGDVCRVFIDGYITVSKEVEGAEPGKNIIVTGLSSYDDTWPDAEYPARIRVRDRADVICGEPEWSAPEWQWESVNGRMNAVLIMTDINGFVDEFTAEADVSSATVRPKCESDGQIIYTATAKGPDGTLYTGRTSETIPATGHDWDEGVIKKTPTENWDGLIIYTCRNDSSHTKREVLPRLKDEDEESRWTFIANLLRRMAEERARQNSRNTEKPDDTTPAETGWKNPFKDVSVNDSFYEAVKFVNENGLFVGVAADRFAPEGTMTRAMFVTVLGRLSKVDVSEYTTTSFSDVETGLWYSEYVEWAAEQGIILGYGDGTFGPENLVNREQAVLIIQRYVKMCGIAAEPSNYDLKIEDAAEVSDWALDAVKWACEKGIFVLDEGLIKPRVPSTRAGIAHLILNLADKLAE